MPGFNLLQNFRSKIAKEEGINNMPGVDIEIDPTLTYDFIVNNLIRLHQKCITPLTEAFGMDDIGITSAYRCKELNEHPKIDGVEDSQHTKGYAIDIISVNHPTSIIFNWAIHNLPEYYQIIWEYPEQGQFNNPNNLSPSWVHIAITDALNQPKIKSIATAREDVHEEYKNNQDYHLSTKPPIRSLNYTHNISKADNSLFI